MPVCSPARARSRSRSNQSTVRLYPDRAAPLCSGPALKALAELTTGIFGTAHVQFLRTTRSPCRSAKRATPKYTRHPIWQKRRGCARDGTFEDDTTGVGRVDFNFK